jgi:hypothetical protein
VRDAIESRLLDELAALDSVSRHDTELCSSAFSTPSDAEDDGQRSATR